MDRARLDRTRIFRRSLRSAAVALALAVVLVLTLDKAPAAQAQTYTVINNFTGGADGGVPLAGLTMDQAGNFYGTTIAGGSQNCFRGCGVVFKLTHRSGGWVFSPLYNFLGGNDGQGPLARVVFGPDGSLYGTTQYGGGPECAGGGCGTVFSLRPPAAAISLWTETVLHSFSDGSDGDGTQPFAAVAFDTAGNMYGTTSSGGSGYYGSIYKLTRTGGRWTESIIHSFTGTDGFDPEAEVTLDASGNLFGTTELGGANNAGTVFELTPSGSGWTGSVLISFPGSSDGQQPYAGVLFDQSGNLYGATAFASFGVSPIVFQLAPAGGGWTINTLYTFTGPAGSSNAGPLKTLTMDSAGNLYGTTYAYGAYGLGNIFRLTRSGSNWIYTDLHDFSGGSDGCCPQSEVTLDASGNLYGTAEGGGTHRQGVVWEITP
jgi:uncharacterized repeat protein (TIGR03803 family)